MACLLNAAYNTEDRDYSRSTSYTSSIPFLIEIASRDYIAENPDARCWIGVAANIIGLILFPLMLVELLFRCIIGAFVVPIEGCIRYSNEDRISEYVKESENYCTQLSSIAKNTFILGFFGCAPTWSGDLSNI